MVVIRPRPGGELPRGFSLLELLVVVAILLILTVLLDGQFTSSHAQHMRAACQGNLQKIYVALNLYANDNHGAFPAQPGATRSEGPLSYLVPRCTTDTQVFICPGSEDSPLPEAEPFTRREISYAYYMGWTLSQGEGGIIASDWQIDNAPKNSGQQIFSPDGKGPGNNHQKHGGNLLFIGGQTIASPPKTPKDLRCPPAILLLNPKP
jgi:prepilin-type N-terminal cleavage/methylation domain-containing protein